MFKLWWELSYKEKFRRSIYTVIACVLVGPILLKMIGQSVAAISIYLVISIIAGAFTLLSTYSKWKMEGNEKMDDHSKKDAMKITDLFDLHRKRTAVEAIIFYIFYLVILGLASGLISVIVNPTLSAHTYLSEQRMGHAVMIGHVFSVITCTLLAFLMLYNKRLFNNIPIILVGISSIVLSFFFGSLAGLMPIAYLTTCEELGSARLTNKFSDWVKVCLNRDLAALNKDDMRKPSVALSNDSQKRFQLNKMGWREAIKIAVCFFFMMGTISMMVGKKFDASSYIANGMGGAVGFVLMIWLVNCFIKIRDKGRDRYDHGNAKGVAINSGESKASLAGVQKIEDVESAISELAHILSKNDKYRQISDHLQHIIYGVMWKSKAEYFNEISKVLTNYIATDRQNIDQEMANRMDRLTAVIQVQSA